MTTLCLARAVHISNVWLLRDASEKPILIDSGHATERALLYAWLWRHGVRRKGDLGAVLLTHRHCDHANNAAALRERFGCPVCIHENDAAFLTGQKQAPPLRRGLGRVTDEIACEWEDRWPARSPVDEAFREGPFKWGFEIINGQGHTEGSSILYHAPSQTAFTGDVLLAGLPPLRLFERLGPAISAYSVDVRQAHENLVAFLDDRPPLLAIAPGHGPLVTKDLPAKLDKLREQVALGLTQVA